MCVSVCVCAQLWFIKQMASQTAIYLIQIYISIAVDFTLNPIFTPIPTIVIVYLTITINPPYFLRAHMLSIYIAIISYSMPIPAFDCWLYIIHTSNQ